MRPVRGILGVLALFCGSLSLQAQGDLELLGSLPSEIGESSGLLVSGTDLITHNDSGNEPILYLLDSTGLQIRRTVRVAAPNTDWEDLAQDDDYIYIGDFGNNSGARTDLAVLRLSKSDLETRELVPVERIGYTYEDQVTTGGTGNSDWDAEALVVRGDSLIIFTKQWQSNGTVAYRIPKTPGQHTALVSGRYDAGGFITGATPAPDGGVVLLGYTPQLQPFLVRIPEASGPFSFPEGTEKILLDIGFGQAEGIAADAAGRFFISTETFSNPLATLPGSVYTFRMDAPGSEPEQPVEGGGEVPEEPEQQGSGELVIYRAQGSDELRYVLREDAPVTACAVFDTSGRMVIYHEAGQIDPGRIDIAALSNSVYYLALYQGGTVLSEPFLRD